MNVRLQVKIEGLAENESPEEVAAWVRQAIAEEYPGLAVDVTVLGYGVVVPSPS